MTTNPLVLGTQNGFKPDPRLTVTEWSNKFRVLTSESSAEAGRYRSDRTPYLEEIMDELSPTSSTEQVKVIKGTQLGFSTIADNVAMCYLDLYPCPILYILPTETLAKGTSKRRLTPSLRATPHLAKKITGGKSKDDIGETYNKAVAGGNLTLGWSNSTSSFRSFSARVVLLDDVNGFGQFGEGDVLELAKARADAFANKKIYINSTPTIAGRSNIDNEFEDSDQREYYMPCPECKEMMIFKWDYMRYGTDKRGYLSGDVRCACPNCGLLIEEYQKTVMMLKGKWRAKHPHQHRGYKLPSFYSPLGWLSWNEIAKEYIKAYKTMKTGDTRLMQVWQNTRNAQSWIGNLKGIEIAKADDRTEQYKAEVPDEVYILTCGVDTQDDRFELEVLGHGRNGETWSIAYKVIQGDPKLEETQKELDNILNKKYMRANGALMKISGTAIDTGGHRTKAMYQYCFERWASNVFAIKGANQAKAPVTNKTIEQINPESLTLFSIGVTALKDDFYANLSVIKKGANYCHFPKLIEYDNKYFRMLTAEKRDDKGQYIKIRVRNESLDCRIYALAVMGILRADVNLMPHPIIDIGQEVIKKNETKNIVIGTPNENYLDEF